MKHTRNLLRELKRRENNSELGTPITDEDFRKAFSQIDRLSIWAFFLFLMLMLCVTFFVCYSLTTHP